MRIALFATGLEPKNGYGNITHELTQQLHKQGMDFTVFLPKSQQNFVNTTSPKFDVQCLLPEYVFRIYQRQGPNYFKTIDVSKYDVIHSLFAFPYCIPAWLSAKKHNKPFILGAQGTHGVRPLTYWPEKLLLKRCYAYASAIQVPSTYTAEQIHKYAATTYPIDIIHNGVSYDRFQKNVDFQSICAKYPNKKILMTVGGLWGRKGHDLVLRALAKIQKDRNDIMYVIVGDGNAKQHLQNLVQELKLEDCVDFTGRKSGDDLVAYFNACDIYVHTPKVIDLKFEGFGIVYIEAGACGKPIVATDAGGIRDAVLDGKTGLIAENENIDDIAHKIIQILDDEALARSLGASGKKYAKEHDWSTITKQYITLYQRVN